MRLLLDTHALVWWVELSSKLSHRARRTLDSGHHSLFVSACSAWEIATKVRLGKLDFDAVFLDDFDANIVSLGFIPLAVTAKQAVTGARTKARHGDPFDRMLTGIAIAEKLKVVTSDPAFKSMGVDTV